jgi:hypothetical protein
MGNIKNHIYFFIAILLLTIIVGSSRLYWIYNAKPSRATVIGFQSIYIDKFLQHYPIVNYKTVKGMVETKGTMNLPINVGQEVDVLYNSNDVDEFKIDNIYWLWFDILSWYGVMWFAILLFYVVFFLALISERRKNQNKKFILSMYDSFPIPLKLACILLPPIILLILGFNFNVPYAKGIAAIIILGFIALGTPSASEE